MVTPQPYDAALHERIRNNLEKLRHNIGEMVPTMKEVLAGASIEVMAELLTKVKNELGVDLLADVEKESTEDKKPADAKDGEDVIEIIDEEPVEVE